MHLRSALFACLLSACSDDSSTHGSAAYPRTVDVEYRVTSASGLGTARLLYTNETGGMTGADAAPLPFSKKLTRTMERSTAVTLSVGSTTPGTLEAAIVVDGAVVDAKTFSGDTVVSGLVSYISQ